MPLSISTSNNIILVIFMLPWMYANVVCVLPKNFVFRVQLVPALTAKKHSIVIVERQEI